VRVPYNGDRRAAAAPPSSTRRAAIMPMLRRLRHTSTFVRHRRAVRLAALVAAFVAAAATGATAPRAADAPPGTLRVVFSIGETSFDPVAGNDAASGSVMEAVFDPLLDYDYLARPVKLVARTSALPEVSDGGRTFTFHLAKGIWFQDDPAFGGKKRELVAADYAYSFARHLDPALHSPWAFVLEGKLVGGDAAQAAARKSGRFDYDAPIAGLEVVDRYTLRIHLVESDYRFPYKVAIPSMGAVAREVVERYGRDFGAHPIGTGPYRLGEYKRSSRIVLEANPSYREDIYTPTSAYPDAWKAVAASLAGKRLPRNARVEISIIEEGQSQWLAFQNGELDLLEIFPTEFVDELLVDGKLRPVYAKRGYQHQVFMRPNVWWTYFNMEDPLVGGYTDDKIALRRAIAMGWDADEYIRVILQGRALPAQGLIPPDIEGYSPRKTIAQLYDPSSSRALLDRFGYKDRNGDGYRETPDGKPLTLVYWSSPNSIARQSDELWKRKMDAIGLRIEFRKDRTPELRKMARQGKIMMRSDGWNADYPDAENFMQVLYGPNIGQANDSRFKLPAFDALYDEARTMPDGPARTALFARMTDLVLAYAPFRMTYHRLEDPIAQPWVHDYVPHPITTQTWKYVSVDAHGGAR
jgi:ABC-type transport system substrate-binding protein